MAAFTQEQDPNELYELVELLGEGSYGAVYKGIHRETGQAVAIKILPGEGEDMRTLEKEIDFLRKMRGEFIVGFYGQHVFEGELWIVMEFCAGGSLSDLQDATDDSFAFTEEGIAHVMAFVVLGLLHLHSNQSIHRDVKAGNILLTADGRAKLADFGVSAQLTNTMSKRKTVIGTPFWMAPEVIQEVSYDGRADVWSLGITAIELAEGNPPLYNVHPMRAIFMIPMKPAPTLKEPAKWSDAFNDFVRRCLVKNPEERVTTEELSTHPFVREEVERIRSTNRGSRILRQLVEDNWDAIVQFRQGDEETPQSPVDADATMRAGDMDAARAAGGGAGGGANAEGDMGTMKRTTPSDTGAAGGGRGGTGGSGTLVRTPSGTNGTADSGGSGTLVRTGTSGGGGAGSGGGPQGSLVRRSSTMRRGGGTSGARGELGAALKYFRNAPSQRAMGDSRGKTSREAGADQSALRAGQAEDAQATRQQFSDRELEKLDEMSVDEIQEQLTALDIQFAAEMEALRTAYESKRLGLENALGRLSQTG